MRLPETLCVHADPGRTAQALDNLIENACAAASRVVLEAECVEGSVLLHVCDDGPGVPGEIRGRPFRRTWTRWPGSR